MKSKQAAEREEQKRIKDLVLGYDARDGEEQDGEHSLAPLTPNHNIYPRNAGLEKAAALSFARSDKSGNNRSAQRNRKLQLSDVDWYDSKPKPKAAFPTVEKKSVPLVQVRELSVLDGEPIRDAVLPSNRVQRLPNQPATAARQVGKLTRKAMLAEHASRIAGINVDSKK